MIKEVYPWVVDKLTHFPELRDSNERLYYNYLCECGYDINTPIKTFLKDMASRKIPYLDSIGRANRKAQELYPELRGKTYNKRVYKREIEVRKEVRDLF